MKKTSSKILSLVLCLTLVCTMFVGLGTVETFAEGAKLVSKDEHINLATATLDVSTANSAWTYDGTFKAGSIKANGTKNLSFNALDDSSANSDQYCKIQTVDGRENVIVLTKQKNGYFDINSDPTTYPIVIESGVFEISADIMADHTPNAANWRVFYTNASYYATMLTANYKKLSPNTWYRFKYTIDLDNDVAYESFIDIANPTDSTKCFTKTTTGYTGGFCMLRAYVTMTADQHLYIDDLKVNHYDTSAGTKATITSVDTTPSETLNFTLDKAITGLEAADVYVTGAAGTKNQATALTDNGGGSYTATLASKLDELTDYTFTIDADCYSGLLEASGDDYVAVTDITAAFTTSDANFTEDTTLAEITEVMTWEELMPNTDISSLTFETKLPTSYRGASISWTSEPEGYVTNAGQIKAGRDADATVTLNANVSINSVAKGIVPFVATIIKEDLVVETVNSTELSQVAMYSPSVVIPGYSSSAGRFYVYYMSSQGINSTEGSRGDELVFMQWNLSDYVQKIEKAQFINILIPQTTSNSDNSPMGKNGLVTVLNNSSDDWTTDDLTYNKAVADGLYTDPGLGTVNEVDFVTDTDTSDESTTIDALISGDALTNGIKAALAQNPDQGLVSFRFSSADHNLCRIRPWGKTATLMQISYYESDLIDDADYAESKAGTMTWDAISTQDTDNVVADLTLPDTWYGLPVTWKSNNSAIADNGTVAVGAEPVTGTLVATVGDETNTFTVRVPASNIALKSDVLRTESEISALNYSTGYIYTNSAVSTPCTAIIATYNADGSLAGVTVKEDITLGEGKNIIPSSWHYAFAGATTKLILVEDMTTLKPLAVAK